VPREYSRTERISELIQRELAQLIQTEVKDPRLGMVTVSAVEVTRDLEHAKVYITVFDTDEKIKKNLAILNHAAGFLRSLLARRITTRTVPELHFIYDVSIKEGQRLSQLIDSALADDERKADHPKNDK
jgi:ribosome-binding factor A